MRVLALCLVAGALARFGSESGGEAFFPATDETLKQVLHQVLVRVRFEYTLAYYTANINRFRKIEVKVNRPGAVALSRTTAGYDSTGGAVHFSSTTCEVSTVEHPYPWESVLHRDPSGALHYHEEFTDSRTGWPNHTGSQYRSGAYEISRPRSYSDVERSVRQPATVAAYGPWWKDFRASVTIDDRGSDGVAGFMFRADGRGYYSVRLTKKPGCRVEFVRTRWPPSGATEEDPMVHREQSARLIPLELRKMAGGSRSSAKGTKFPFPLGALFFCE